MSDLFDKAALIEDTSHDIGEGSLDVSIALLRAMNRAIKVCKKHRAVIAAEMTVLIWGDEPDTPEITKAMLDSWTAESKPQNRIPAEYIPAFVEVTGATEIVAVLLTPLGIIPMQRDQQIFDRLGRLAMQEQDIATQRARLMAACPPNQQDRIAKSRPQGE